jgi:hypothetical protein
MIRKIYYLCLIVLLPAFSFAQAEVNFTQPSATQTEAVITLSLPVSISAAPTDTVIVSLVQVSGTASQVNDFDISAGTIVFPKDSTNPQNFSLNIYEDALGELTENAVFKLVYQSGNGTLGVDSFFTLTITDNDTLRISFDSTAVSLNEGSGNFTIPVTLTGTPANSTSVTVTFSLAGSNANISGDFIFANAFLTWPANTSGTQLVSINVTDDAVNELNEVANFILLGPSAPAILGDSVFTVTILDDDTAAKGDCADLFFSEYFEGSGNNKALEIYNPTNNGLFLNNYRILKYTNGSSSPAEYTFFGAIGAGQTYVIGNPFTGPTIANASNTTSTFIDFDGNDALVLLNGYDTIDVIGVPGQDPGAAGWLVPNGNGSTFDHPLIRDQYVYHGSTDWATGVSTWYAGLYDIADSLGQHHVMPCGTLPPFPPSLVGFALTLDTVIEDSVFIPVVYTVNNVSNSDAVFRVFADAPSGTATIGLDYVFAVDTIYAPPGNYTDTFWLQLWKDDLLEPLEFIRMRMDPIPGNNTIAIQPNLNIYIISDTALFVSFLGASYAYPEDTGTVQVRIFVTKPMPVATEVTIALSAGSATPGTDFNFTNPTVLTFPANTADTLTFDVEILNDNVEEPNEQLNFDIISANNNARRGIWAFTMVIVDNDSTVGISEELLSGIATIYPNPATGSLLVNAQMPLQNVMLTDLLGNVVTAAKEVNTGISIIDISALTPGMYFIAAESRGIRYTKKVIVQ